ncbi:hypothetical protein GGI12_003931 [Dipsacomyces acuminosporus]|nr:hypothetical protein GGI12_003931 [Dipsacomyces acuminosporus]
MEDIALQPSTYLIINERTPGMPILYVSSSIREALLYEPQDFIGHSALEFVADTNDVEELRKHHGTFTDDNVIMTNCIVKSKDNQDVYIRTIVFACGNVNLGIVDTFPNITSNEQLLQYQQQEEDIRALSVQRFKCILSEQTSNNTLGRNAIYSLRTTYQACIVTENKGDNINGPEVVFVTSSINRILEADSCELQGLPFLSLVAEQDSIRACDFLEKALYSKELVLETLRLLVNPLEESETNNPKLVSVEFMAKGSDDGVIMLCQVGRYARTECNDNGGYMSLEDIITSDPETSDCPELWNMSIF